MLTSRVRWPRPRSRNPLLRIARWIWTLPTNLIGHLAGRLVSDAKPRRVGGPAAVAWLYPIRPGLPLKWFGAVTLGNAILYRAPILDSRDLRARLTLAHELAHTRQSDWLGPLYLPLHGLAQAVSALISIGRPVVVSRLHDHNPLEQTFICIAAAATRPPFPPGVDPERLLDAFAV